MDKKLVHSVFLHISQAFPHHTAISEVNGNISYENLNQYVNQIAVLLIEQGIQKGDVIGSSIDPSIDYVASMLAVLKVGAIFMPLDAETPKKRLAFVFEKTAPKQIIRNNTELADYSIPVTLLPAFQANKWIAEPDIMVDGNDSAYIIFTSGSTGFPKIIEGQHKGLSHFIHWEIKTFVLDGSARVSWLAPPTFDVSLRDIFVPLLSGGTLVIPDAEGRKKTSYLTMWLAENAITLLHCVPSIFRVLTKEFKDTPNSKLPDLQKVLLAGEPIYAKDVTAWRELFGERIELVNLYGPSETTLAKAYFSIKTLPSQPQAIIPIGQAISNSVLLIIKNHRLCASGEIGEIFIKTPFRTKGYYGDAELTATVFVQNPLHQDSEDIVYKTGDMGRYLENHVVEFLGRQDNQVKINGVRIELTEVEQAVLTHDLIEQAVVIAQDGVLVCYFVACEPLTNDELRDHLRQWLPSTMLPTFFVSLTEMPLNLHGKVDRKALPKPNELLYGENFQAPENEIESELVEQWQQLLGLTKIGVTHAFIDMGGDSLKAMRMIAGIYKAFNVDISLKDFFEQPTIRHLATLIAKTKTDTQQNILPCAEAADYAVSHSQKRLWLMDKMHIDSVAYNLPETLLFKGELNIDVLRNSLQVVVNRHESLRTRFIERDGEPRQVIENFTIKLPLIDLSNATDADAQALIWVNDDLRLPFNLQHAPLFRACVLKLAPQRHVLLFNIHHIISDGWSLGILTREWLSAYRDLTSGYTPSFIPLSIQYKDYAAWQNAYLESEKSLKHRDYWLEKLAGELPILEFPTDYRRPAVQTFNGETLHFKLPDFVLQQFKALLNKNQVSLFMGLCAVVKILLHRYSGQQDVILGTPVAGRSHAELENQQGFYVNTLALRDFIEPEKSFETLLEQVKITATNAFDYQLYPFDVLVDDLTLQRDMSRSPIFDVMLALQNNEAGTPAIEGLSIEPFVKENHWDISRYDLLFHFGEDVEGLALDLNFNPDLYSEKRMQRMGTHVLQLFDGILKQPNDAIATLPMFSFSEVEQLASFNPSPIDITKQTIADAFEQQVLRTPNQVALMSPTVSLTYEQLNQQANGLAEKLQSLNLERAVVAVYSERIDVVLMLACLKIGAVYLPIYRDLPVQRIQFMLQDSDCKLILHRTETPLPEALSTYANLAWSNEVENEAANPKREISPDDVAYILYTSGSTGHPKGVKVKHAGFVNMALAQISGFTVTAEDTVLQFASMAFDASLSEVFMALLSGAKLVTIEQAIINDTTEFVAYLARYGVTHITLPPVYLQALQRQPLPTLKTLITAGEAANIDDALFYAKQCNYFNAYGPTETSVCASFYRVNPQGDYSQRIPVGSAISNLEFYLLDDALNQVSIGVTGEIYIAGIGVAEGYINAPELTAASFVSIPQFSNSALYKTGDLGCWNDAGQVEYFGRKDQQVKVSGYRIETAEVDFALRQFPAINQAVVTTQRDANGQNALCAYYTRAKKVELFPSIAEFYVYDDVVYGSMATDYARNDRYRAAFGKVLNGKTVVEIGPGPEVILSRLCLEAGAEKIYAIELLEETYLKAKQTLKRLGLEDKIQLIHGNAMTTELPEKVDYCISEIVGGIGGSEGAAKIINSARRFLNNPQNMLPTRSLTKIAAFSLSENDFEFNFSAIAAHYVERIFTQVGYPFDLRLCVKNFAESEILTNADVFEDLDYTHEIPLETKHEILLNFEQDSLFTGFLVWLTLYPDADEVIDILYSQDSWIPVYLPVSITGIPVSKGDVFKATLQRKLCANDLNPDYFIAGTLTKIDGSMLPISYSAYHDQPQFRASEFYQRLFAENAQIPLRPMLAVEELRRFLAESLPAYMIPTHFIELENLPLSVAGKINLKALPAPFVVEQNEQFSAPTTDIEKQLVEIWQDVLDQSPIGIHDHYFHRGGDSIRAIQIVARLRDRNLKLDVRDIFQYPTIYELATQVNELVKTIDQSPVTGNVPLTPIQEWFFAQNNPAPQHFNQAVLLKFNQRVEKENLQTVCEVLHFQHDALRTQFEIENNVWVQKISAPHEFSGLQEVNLCQSVESAQAMQHHADLVQAAIDLKSGSLFNAVLYHLPECDYVLLFCHHLVIDGVSWRILLEDFSAVYQQILNQQPIALPSKMDSFQRHAEQLLKYAESSDLNQQLAYWQTVTANVNPKPQATSGATVADVGEFSLNLNEADTHLLLTDIHRAFNTRIDDVLLAALAISVYQWRGDSQALIEMEGHGRDELADLNTQRTVGWFTTAYPKLLHYDSQHDLAILLKETKESLRKIPNKGIGYGVLRYLGKYSELAVTPEIGFNYLGQMNAEDKNELFSIDWQGLGEAVSSQMPLAHELDILSLVDKRSLCIHISYNQQRFSTDSIRQFGELYLQNLSKLCAFCMAQNSSEITPSDLTYQEMSLDELDSLFAE